ncbi:hypothetical protein V1511DRAFT_454244 [Dipodascopsis uninucleata]
MPTFNYTEFYINYDKTSFLNSANNRGLLYAHIASMVISCFGLLPLSIMFSVAGSPLHIPVHVSFLSLFALGFFLGVIYEAGAPDLYPGNVHSKFAWIMLVLVSTHFGSLILKSVLEWMLPSSNKKLKSKIMPHNNANDDDDVDGAYSNAGPYSYHVTHNNDPDDSDTLNGSVDGTYEDVEKMHLTGSGSNSAPALELRVQQYVSDRLAPLQRALSRYSNAGLVRNLYTITTIVFALLNRPMILIAFFQIMTGIITATCIGKSSHVFSMLAHHIKGAVFLWMGVLTFGRVLGSFANYGWAWNIRPKPVPGVRQSFTEKFFRCSMEMIESSLIFFYGTTNVFLEHLGSKDGSWSHKDLQHASIAFMYIGGGLAGILFESSTVRSLLAANRAVDNSNSRIPRQYKFSYNPFPAFTIFWTGILMSQHHQTLEMSTKIHMQWGYMLSFGAIIRLITYFMLYVSPPTSTIPSRPMTEVLVSFCLLAGGAVFMISHDETVESMLYWGLDGMFSLNLTVGFTALAMSWITVLLSIKGWAYRRVN